MKTHFKINAAIALVCAFTGTRSLGYATETINNWVCHSAPPEVGINLQVQTFQAAGGAIHVKIFGTKDGSKWIDSEITQASSVLRRPGLNTTMFCDYSAFEGSYIFEIPDVGGVSYLSSSKVMKLRACQEIEFILFHDPHPKMYRVNCS